MSLELITAPAGSGKTQCVLEQIRAQCERNPLSRILVIVPSSAQLIGLRQRLGALAACAFGVTLTDFHTLYRDLLDTAGVLPRQLPETARYRILRAIICQLATTDQLHYFAPLAEKPGFIGAVSDLLAELQASSTLPEHFAQLATTPRTRDLATIYAAYQTFLREHYLADRERMGWLACQALQADPRLYAHYDYIVADGFDEFNPNQLAVLTLLAARVPQLDVTLTYQPDRLAHIRSARTLDAFKYATRCDLAPHAPPRTAPLQHLERHLFELNSPRVPAQEAVTLIAAPDRVREVRAIARHVKRLLIAGVPPDEIGILFRQLDPYQNLVREIFTEFGIPFCVREGMPLKSNPLLAAFLNLLTLSANDFSWRTTLDALRSPYVTPRTLSADDVALIEQITREAVVVKGRAAWLDAFTRPSAPLSEDEEDTRRVMQLGEETLADLRARLAAFMQQITPPARGTPHDFVAWIERLFGPDPRAEAWQKEHFPEHFIEDATSLRIIERARDSLIAEIIARDVCALNEFANLLRGIVLATDVLQEGEIAWGDFLADVVDAVDAATYDLQPTLDGRVVIATVTQARGVPKEYIFLGGLLESEFPLRAPEDPLLTARERNALRDAGVPLSASQTHDETTLFYEAVTLARQQLWLTYPQYDDDANPLYPSPYLDAVHQVLDNVPIVRLSPNQVPSADEAASLSELSISLTRTHADASARAMDALLQKHSPARRHGLVVRAIEARRESPAPHDEFSGVISDNALRAEIALKFGDDYLWSASQFNEWGACGFRFFAKRLLRLKEIADPEEGLDALHLGTLYHAILEQTYRQFIERAIAVTPTTLSQAQSILQETAEQILNEATTRWAFRPNAWWREECDEIVRRLKTLLQVEAERNGEDAPRPIALEVPFGFAGEPALRIQLPIGTIRVIGKIDRIDQGREGVVLIDYKTGSTPIRADQVIEGRNLQLPIYVFAAQAQGYRVSDAFFLHLRGAKTSGNYAEVDQTGWLGAAKEHLNRYVRLARAGAFAVAPTVFENGKCDAHCEFAALCRVTRWSIKPIR
jgi:ATP-dependent helicase/nuclease subunit B